MLLMNRHTSQLLRRYILLFISLAFNALGIDIVTVAALGTSPISSVPYVVSKMMPLSFGELTFCLNMLFLAGQALLLGPRRWKENRMFLLLQIPVLTVFSAFVDLWMHFLEEMEGEIYISRVAVLVGGCAVLALGISLSVKANVVLNPGEAIVKVLSDRFKVAFGWMKLIFDCSLVVVAITICYIVLGHIVGLREGTLVAAFLVGPLERIIYPHCRFLDRFVS